MREIYLSNKSRDISFSYLHEDSGSYQKKKEDRTYGPDIEEVLTKFYRARSRKRAREQISHLKISTEFCHKLWIEFPQSYKSKALIDSYNSMVKYRNRIVEGNLGLVNVVVRSSIRRITTGYSIDDLNQEGKVGLLWAVEKFDPYKGMTFANYALWWIKQSITKAVRKHTYTVIPPAHIYILQGKMYRLKDMLRVKHSREPTLEDIAEELDIDVDSLSSAIEVMSFSYNPVIPNDHSNDHYVEGHSSIPLDMTPFLMNRIKGIMRELSPREKAIIEQRFGLNGNGSHTLEEVGDMFNISRERVRQLESEIIEGFRKKLGKV